jgi:hypothetical protein
MSPASPPDRSRRELRHPKSPTDNLFTSDIGPLPTVSDGFSAIGLSQISASGVVPRPAEAELSAQAPDNMRPPARSARSAFYGSRCRPSAAAVIDLCPPSIYSLRVSEGAPEHPSPQTDRASRAGAKARAIDPDQGQGEAVRLSHGKWRGYAPAPDAGSDGFHGFEKVPPLGHLSDQSQGDKDEYLHQKRGT